MDQKYCWIADKMILRNSESELRTRFAGDKRKIGNVKRTFLEHLDKKSLTRKKPSRIANYLLNFMRAKQSSGMYVYLRAILTRLYPFDPLESFPRSSFGLAILTSPKDSLIFPYSLGSLLNLYSVDIEKIWIIAPRSMTPALTNTKKVFEERYPLKIELISDEKILEDLFGSKKLFNSTVAKMEFIKLYIGSEHPSEEILVVDGDTLYLKSRNWSTGDSSVLPISQEYFPEHVAFHSKALRLLNTRGVGFITHHSYFKKEYVKRLIAEMGGFETLATLINNGIVAGFGSGAFPSEWQMYGDWVVGRQADSLKLANFNNLGMARGVFPLVEEPTISEIEKLLFEIKSVVPSLGSLSLHDYKG